MSANNSPWGNDGAIRACFGNDANKSNSNDEIVFLCHEITKLFEGRSSTIIFQTLCATAAYLACRLNTTEDLKDIHHLLDLMSQSSKNMATEYFKKKES